MSTPRVLVVRVGTERFALPVEIVSEVLEAPPIGALPLTPAGVLGQCAWRGQWVPVLEARAVLGVAAAMDGRGVVLVLTSAAGPFALRADDVEEVLDLLPEALRAVPAGTGPVGRLTALLRTAEGLVAVADAGALIAAGLATLQSEVSA